LPDFVPIRVLKFNVGVETEGKLPDQMREYMVVGM
jgi:hypothetical protein